MARVTIEFVGNLSDILAALYAKRQSDAKADILFRNKNQSVRIGSEEISIRRNGSSEAIRLSADTEVVFYRNPRSTERGIICTFMTSEMDLQINVRRSLGELEVVTRVLSQLPTAG